jgi:hypothetical protein
VYLSGEEEEEDLQEILTHTQVRRAYAARSLHENLCHPSDLTLTNSLNNGCIIGTHVTARDVVNANTLLGRCLACLVGKTVKPVYKESISEPTTRVGEKVYCDIVPLQEGSEDIINAVGGYDMFLLTVDSFCNMIHKIPLKSKKVVHLIEAFDILLAEYTKFGHKKVGVSMEIISDSESDFVACRTLLGERGVQLSHSPPHQHNQRLERQVRTLKERIRCVKSSALVELPGNMTGEVWSAAISSVNDLANTKFTTQSPRQMFEGVKLDVQLSNNIMFGTPAMILFPEDKDQRARLGVVLGPGVGVRNSSKCWVFNPGKIVTRSRNMITILPVIPIDFPWKAKTGKMSLSVAKRKYAKKTAKDKQSREPKTTASTSTSSARPTEPVLSREGEIGLADISDEIGIEDVNHLPSAPSNMAQDKPASVLDSVVAKAKAAMLASQNRARVEKNDRHTLRALGADNRRNTLNKLYDKAMDLQQMEGVSPTATPGNSESEKTEDNVPGDSVRADNVFTDVRSDANPKDSVQSENVATDNVRSNNKPSKAKVSSSIQPPAATRVSQRQSQQKDKVLERERLEKRVRGQYKISWVRKIQEVERVYKLSVKDGLEGDHPQESKEAVISEIQNMLQYKVGHYTM